MEDLKTKGYCSIPMKPLICMIFLVIVSQLVAEVTYPFVPFMIQDFSVTSPLEIGYYTGWIATAFGTCQLLSRFVFN